MSNKGTIKFAQWVLLPDSHYWHLKSWVEELEPTVPFPLPCLQHSRIYIYPPDGFESQAKSHKHVLEMLAKVLTFRFPSRKDSVRFWN